MAALAAEPQALSPFDPSSGTLVSTRPAVSGYRYRVTSHVRPIDDSLAKALISQTPADRAYAQLPNPPAWLRAEAERIVRGYPTPATQLLAIEAHLKTFGYAVSARPGHSYGAVQRVLLGRAENEAGYDAGSPLFNASMITRCSSRAERGLSAW